MMKKSDAETAIRLLARQWHSSLSTEKQEHPSFLEFKSWLRDNGYGAYLQFRSVMGPDEDAERWFDDELGQSWRQ